MNRNHQFIMEKPSGMKPEDAIEGPAIRRLVIIEYVCGLCQERHEAQCYMTAEEQTPKQLLERMAEIMSEPETAQRILDNYAGILHEENRPITSEPPGRRPESAERPHLPIGITMTSESEYTCNNCQATFETIEQYRTHQGRNQDTARKESSTSMIPESLICPMLRRREPPE